MAGVGRCVHVRRPRVWAASTAVSLKAWPRCPTCRRATRQVPYEEQLELVINNYPLYFTARNDHLMDPSYDGPDSSYFFDLKANHTLTAGQVDLVSRVLAASTLAAPQQPQAAQPAASHLLPATTASA